MQSFCTQASELVVGASAVPHAQILRQIAPALAQSGIRLKVIEFDDYDTPNTSLAEGRIDANFFQHGAYLDKVRRDKGLAITGVANVHLEPMAIYSTKIRSFNVLQKRSVIAIPNDPINCARALTILAERKVIDLRKDTHFKARLSDIERNPKQIEFRLIDASEITRVLPEVDAAVINSNYALQANLTPMRNAISFEQPAGSPFVNKLVVREKDVNRPDIQALVRALHSPQVREFIEQTYHGAVIAAF